MKPIKLGTLAAVAVLSLGVYSTKASLPVTIDYSKLNVSATIITNCATITKGDVDKYTTKTVKIGNKQLLNLFTNWAGTTWPAGAQLVVGWDIPWDGDVLVVDKTGTNVLYDANAAPDHYFVVDFFNDIGAGTGTYVNADPGSKTISSLNGATFALYDDYYFLNYTDLSGYGGSTQSFKQTWDINDNPLKWSDTESAKFPNQGDQKYLDVGWDTTVSGTISASGHGKDYNYLGWAD